MRKDLTGPTAEGRVSRRGFLGKVLGLGLCPAAAGGAVAGNQKKIPPKGPKMVRWQGHPVAKIPNGYQVAVADVDGDGKLDILGLSSVESIVEWYQNPDWHAQAITTETAGNISLAPLFRPGYPARGVALASAFSLDDSEHGGYLWWAEPPGSPDSEWPLRLLGQIPTSHRLRWANLDGSGRLMLVDVPLLGAGAKAPDYAVGAPITCFEMPEIQLRGHLSAGHPEASNWTPHLIDDSLNVVHGVHIMDWDGDGRDEILTASFQGVHLFHPEGQGSDLRWTKTQLASGDQTSRPRRGSSEIDVGKVGRRRFLATIEPWHGEQVVVYWQDKPGALWSRHVIDDTFHDGHALVCADLNGDGNDEIVAGYRGPGTSLFVYYAADSAGSKWERQTLDTDTAASGVVIADVNDDGRPDVVAIGASTGNVKWYENQGVRGQETEGRRQKK